MEDQLVIISAYTNPHVFYILFEKDREKLVELEKSLLKHKDAFKETSVILKEYIAVNDKGKWKRALVQNYKREVSKYECWLIDYGEVFITDKIYELPKCFLRQPFIQPACLYNTVPLKSSFSIELAKPVHEKQLNFCPGTIKVVGDYIKKAKSITFRLRNVINGVFCGSLHLQYEKHKIDLIKELVKTNHVILDEDLFLQVIKDSFSTTHSYVSYMTSVLPRPKSSGSCEDFSMGRGYHRHKSDKQHTRTGRTASNCLAQNKIKGGGTSRRPTTSSSIFNINARSSVSKHSSSTSSEKDDNASFEKSETKTNADNAARLNAIPKYPANMSMKEMVDCLNNNKNTLNMANSESPLTQDAVRKCSPNKSLNGSSVQDDREVLPSSQSSISSGSDVGNVSPAVFDLKSLIKGRGKSKITVSSANKELSPNRSDLNKSSSSPEVQSIDLNNETTSLNRDNNFKCVLTKIKKLAHSSPKREDDKWEDVEDSDTYSENITGIVN